MKFLVIIAVLTEFAYSLYLNDNVPEPRFTSDAIIQQMFEMLRHVIRNGIPEKDVPVLDPANIADGKYQYSFGKLLNAEANISNGFISGLGDFHILKSDFDKEELSLDLRFVFPLLKLQANPYQMEGNIYNIFPIKGEGNLYFQMNDVEISSKVFLKQSLDGKSVLIDNFQFLYHHVSGIKSETTFDHNIDLIINAMIEDLLADYLNRFNGKIPASEIVMNIMNPFLEKLDSWRLITLILN